MARLVTPTADGPSEMMSPRAISSVFQRMSRYPPRQRFNATENQHTEALAAVLEASPSLMQQLIATWLNFDPASLSGEVRVRTQAPARGLERVDLELRVGPPGALERIVWVEVKVDARLSGEDQLKHYWDALRAHRAAYHALVLLQRWDVPVPPAELLPCDVHSGDRTAFVITDWQTVGQVCAQSRSSAGGFARGLIDHFLIYLQKDGLAMTDAFRSEHVVALEHFAAGTAALDRIVRGAAATIRSDYKPDVEPSDDDSHASWPMPGPYYWWTYPAPSDCPDDVWLELDFIEWKHLGGTWAVAAGLTTELGNSFGDATAVEHFRSREFEHVREYDHCRYVRFKRPAELLAADTLDEQVDLLTTWTHKAFTDAIAAVREFGPSESTSGLASNR